jgi:hypothetical protein
MAKKYKLVRLTVRNKAIITDGSGLFLASFADTSMGPEVMVFPCDAYGVITDWLEIDGGRGYKSLQEFLDLFTTPATFVTL